MMSNHNEAQQTHYARQYANLRPSLGIPADMDLYQWAKWYPLIVLDGFLETLRDKSVVTICSGAGRELGLLHSHGADITATDLTVEHLGPLVEEGIIREAAQQNAERLSYSGKSYDYGFVNAGLHHLCYPHAGLCELLRTARKAVIFIENQDSLLFTVRRMLGKTGNDFEPAGNYVYRWKTREIEKICASAHTHSFAIRTSFLPLTLRMKGVTGPRMRFVKAAHSVVDTFLSPLGNLIITIIFIEPPTGDQLAYLKRNRFRYRITQKPRKS